MQPQVMLAGHFADTGDRSPIVGQATAKMFLPEL